MFKQYIMLKHYFYQKLPIKIKYLFQNNLRICALTFG